MKKIINLVFLLFICCLINVAALRAQDNTGEKTKSESKKDEKKKDEKSKKADKAKNGGNAAASIGGKEHEAEILGVKIGMNVPSALEAVFVSANRKPGQEKPDAQRKDGKDGKDIRVLYKNLPQGDLQIVFAEGKTVKEILLSYAEPPNIADLRLPFSSDIEIALDGDRFDDRYSVGFTDNQKVQRTWWRDEKTAGGYRTRLQFFSPNKIKDAGAKFVVTAVQKLLFVTPGDEAKFAQSYSLSK